jgi:hypothetical protein
MHVTQKRDGLEYMLSESFDAGAEELESIQSMACGD